MHIFKKTHYNARWAFCNIKSLKLLPIAKRFSFKNYDTHEVADRLAKKYLLRLRFTENRHINKKV